MLVGFVLSFSEKEKNYNSQKAFFNNEEKIIAIGFYFLGNRYDSSRQLPSYVYNFPGEIKSRSFSQRN